MHLSSFVALALAVLTAAAPSARPYILHEKREHALQLWKRDGRPAKDQILPVRIGLKQRNLEHADRFLFDVADPSSPNYGKHWSAEKVANVFAPSAESSDRTVDWLTDAGIDPSRLSFSKGRNWIELDATVSEMEELLQTEYHNYQHQELGGYRIACDSYHVPEEIRSHIDFIMPTVQLDGMRPVAQKKLRIHNAPASTGNGTNSTAPFTPGPLTPSGLTGLENCGTFTTIPCLRALYNFGPGNYSDPSNKLGIAEWSDYLYYPDLKIFFENFTSPQIPSDTLPEFISIDGGKPSNLTIAEEGDVIESALDFQTAYSIIWPQQIRQYQLGDSVNVDSVGTFNIFLDALDASYCTYEGGDQPYVDPEYPDPNEGGYTGPLQCGGAPVSNVFSVSYGQIEGALGTFYQERQCHEWAKLGLQGVSVVFASGDSGVANRYNSGYNNTCLNEKHGYVEQDGKRFSPSFPANCPYITAVGATQLKSSNVSDGEVAVNGGDPNDPYNDFYSGGGFSAIFPRPAWQERHANRYLRKYAPKYSQAVFNHFGRGFPDVSANGLALATVYLGEAITVGGTSASSPIFASILVLLNEERLKAGKKPIGFVNPVLYAHEEMFNDITEGGNPGCGSQGFPAAPGWDPVTGLGTPDYEKMKAVFLALP